MFKQNELEYIIIDLTYYCLKLDSNKIESNGVEQRRVKQSTKMEEYKALYNRIEEREYKEDYYIV